MADAKIVPLHPWGQPRRITPDDQLTKPVKYRNSQWAVTGYGMECLVSSYVIERKALGDIRPGTDLPEWPIHLAGKCICDDAVFLHAFALALHLHKVNTSHWAADWFEKVMWWTARKRVRQEQFEAALDAIQNAFNGVARANSMTQLNEARKICAAWDEAQCPQNSVDAILARHSRGKRRP